MGVLKDFEEIRGSANWVKMAQFGANVSPFVSPCFTKKPIW